MKAQQSAVRLEKLKVCESVAPIGVDRTPTFSWIPHSEGFGQHQSAYRLTVSSTKAKADALEGDLWDSGRVESSRFYSICYRGAPLTSHTTYYWRAESWNGENERAVSDLSYFTTGILSPDEWEGDWIGQKGNDRAAVYLRRECTLARPVREAILSIAGLGYFELTVNGMRPDDTLLNCCNTQYNRTVLYRTFDVTKLLREGENALGVLLGNGFYNEQGGVWNWENAVWRDAPKMRLQMTLRYQDGSSETIVSDERWQVNRNGPITFNSIYYGENYDARKEAEGWDRVGFDARTWQHAERMDAPTGKLVCQLEDPIRRMERFRPTTIKTLDDGSYVVCCPEMVTGWASFTFRNTTAGDEIAIRYGEKLNSDGSVQKLGGEDGVNAHWWRERNIMTDLYTSKGRETEVYEPKFSYKGFAYIQISGYKGILTVDDIEICRIRNDLAQTGHFVCSNALLNDLHAMTVRTMMNNIQGKPTDTPVWEKNGWLGDLNVALDSFAYNFDLSNFLPNFIGIMTDCFKQYRLLPQMVPTADWGIANHYVWNSVLVFAIRKLWKSYGMVAYMREQYSLLKSYAEGVIADLTSNGWICSDHQLGDWVSPMGTDPSESYCESPNEGSGIVGSAYVYGMLSAMSEIAEATGNQGDVEYYQSVMAKIFDAFNEKFYDPEQGCYQTTQWHLHGPNRTRFRQTSQLVALAFGLVPEERVQVVVSSLVRDIEEKGFHLDTGCVGSKEILPILCEYGHAELAYQIATQTTYPSWGYMIERGATSLWEMWEDTTRSVDHYFLGTYDEWFYEYLAGIKEVENGYETFTVAPLIPEALDCVTCTIDTVRGGLESSWRKVGGKLEMKLTIPYGATANVHLPFANATVNGRPIAEKNSLTLVSGSYTIAGKVG